MGKSPSTTLKIPLLTLLAALSGTASAWDKAVDIGREFSSAEADSHTGRYDASRIIDGYRDKGSRWQSDAPAQLYLDAGSLQMMQGLYVWATNSNRSNYWLRVETSADGADWDMQYRAIPTRTNAEAHPVYLPLPRSGSAIRHVRISAYGGNADDHTRLSEVRWLSVGDDISQHPQVHRASWNVNHGPISSGPHIYAWSDDLERHLSRQALVRANEHAYLCPAASSEVFYPQAMVIDVSGSMESFLTRKTLPDTTIAYAMDWSHIDLSDPGEYGEPGLSGGGYTPREFHVIQEDWSDRVDSDGTTGEYGAIWRGCDPHYPYNDFGVDEGNDYWRYKQATIGNVDSAVTDGWDIVIASEIDPGFSIEASYGLPFANVGGTAGSFTETTVRASDGYVDVGSRWSSNDESAFLELSTGPGVTQTPPVRGVYLWTHKSNARNNIVSIDVRTDGGDWYTVLEKNSLPSVPWDKPVFIPVTLGLAEDVKHVRVWGHGSNESAWSSIAEVRYSDSTSPDEDIAVIDPRTPHPLRGNSFSFARAWQKSDSGQTTNTVDQTIDGSAAPMNYYATNRPYELTLGIGHVAEVGALNIWMHRSSERSSEVTVRAYLDGWIREKLHEFTVTLPRNPNNDPIRVDLPEIVIADHFEIDFSGNSNNSWNSVSEVSWE